jgi:hypothetical protein
VVEAKEPKTKDLDGDPLDADQGHDGPPHLAKRRATIEGVIEIIQLKIVLLRVVVHALSWRAAGAALVKTGSGELSKCYAAP